MAIVLRQILLEEDYITYSCWVEAIVALVRNEDSLDYEDLKEWLIEDCDWPEVTEDKIHDSYLRYEVGKDVINVWINENKG